MRLGVVVIYNYIRYLLRMVEYYKDGFLIEEEPEIESPPSWSVRILILVIVIILYPAAQTLLLWKRLRAK